ncbi:DoxX family protein [Cytophagaceae bacterium DM2B3-1]|uniref:DoxX family protein n=1 Tax=Xanthocytophaga flava TaxID=3048013 RepID=A0ABT7CXV4_9BACT|nr:DoxX family protein [Xanthocytophaga flavus]MDJ1472881.1 DoxX family protein [Xanthocytophaga flavus]MDJ1498563.1 DoxX family protein [Xanthocytophaga flavus]
MKSRKIITLVVTALASLMVILSGIMKLTKNQSIVDVMNKVGVGQYITLLGIMEIVFTALFIYPKTMKIGFILLTCYFAGAIATELSHNGPLANAMMPLVLVWIATFLRDSSVFLPSPEPSQS